jgi:cytochrome c
MNRANRIVTSLTLAVALTWSASALADINLARKSGCFICHGIETDAKGPDGLKPVGPPFKSVAARYKDDKNASKMLENAVMMGSSPYSRHWQHESSGVAMPPNSTVINEQDAKKLVAWVLGLK